MEKVATVRKDIELLGNELEMKSITKPKVLDRLQNMADSLKNLEEETEKEKKAEEKKEKEKAKEGVEKGLSQSVKNVIEELEQINKSEIELRKDTNTSLDDIRLKNMMFTAFMSALFGVQAGLDKQKWWMLFSMVICMALSSLWVIQKVGFELWGFRKKFRELYKKQKRVFETGNNLIMDWQVSEGKDNIGDELKENFSKLHKLITLDMIRVRYMGWTYLGNYILFSLFSLAIPVFLYFVLMGISEKDADFTKLPPPPIR